MEPSINQIQDEIVEEFLSIGDPLSQYEYLLEYAGALQPMNDLLKTDENLVKGCTSKAWLAMENCEGHLSLEAASDTLIIRGILCLLIDVLDGQPLKEVAEADLYFLEKAQLMSTFTSSRRQGIGSVVQTIREFAYSCLTNSD